jgi:hypothetical protein
MSSNIIRPALICPYTLMEEEALDWSVLLFGQAILLHPFPLPLPASIQSLADQGILQVRSLVQTPEAIREKDRVLRGIKQYVVDNPGRGFLKYLNEVALMEDQETQEEITGLMKGRPFLKPPKDFSIINGPILLGLIHDWMMQEWEVESSLALIEEQEKKLIQGWQENPEEGSVWESIDPLVLKRNEAEIHCPPALAAWWELKNTLVPEPITLFTTQQWVWTEYYGLDPEEGRISSIPLPDLGSLNKGITQNTEINGVIRDKMEAVLRPTVGSVSINAVEDFQKYLLELGLPPEGKYRLVFPPNPPSFSSPRGSDPLILLLPALT